MYSRGHVLVSPPSDGLAAALTHVGLGVICTDADALSDVDAVAAHVCAAVLGSAGAVDQLRGNPDFAAVPVILMDGGARISTALELGVEDVMDARVDDGVFLARLRPLLRLSTVLSEAALRSRTAAGFGVQIDLAAGVDQTTPRVMIAASNADRAAVLEGLLGGETSTDSETNAFVAGE